MDRICKELYSNNTYGEARSINIDDLNNVLNYTPRGGEYYNSKWNELKGFKIKLKDFTNMLHTLEYLGFGMFR